MRFHLDEHVADAVAEGLRRRGVDVTTTAQAQLLQASDEKHLAYALENDRVILTHDVDFLRIAATGQSHAGIIYCPQQKRTIGEIVRLFALMNECLEDDAMRGKVQYL